MRRHIKPFRGAWVTNAPCHPVVLSAQRQSLLCALGVCVHTGRGASRAVFPLLPGAAGRRGRGGPASPVPAQAPGPGACGKGSADGVQRSGAPGLRSGLLAHLPWLKKPCGATDRTAAVGAEGGRGHRGSGGHVNWTKVNVKVKAGAQLDPPASSCSPIRSPVSGNF